jgi:hypothetical protein
MRNILKNMTRDFKLFEAGIGGSGEGATNTNVPNASDEQAVIDKLDRSVKFDEIDSVTFGLETDDGKIVKVYVNAEQAEPFEKALAAKLGEIDDIEEVLNDLSKEYEIIDVEWPEGEGEEEDEEDEEVEDDGSSSLDQRVYGPNNKNGTVEDNFDRNFGSSEATSEELNYGEEAILALLESAASIESRFSTASQLMVYHAIIDLGVPEIALARNPYRAAIIKGIKEAAAEIQQNGQMKTALKNFIRHSFDYEKEAEKNENTAEKKTSDKTEQSKNVSDDTKGIKEDVNLNEAWQTKAVKGDFSIEWNRGDGFYLAKKGQPIEKWELLAKDSPSTSYSEVKAKFEKRINELSGVSENMKINITEEKIDWAFKSEDGRLSITSKQITMELDDEESEKLVKGLNNRNVTVVRDHTESPAKKFVFSPRGSTVLVKAVGQDDGFMMSSKDVEALMAAAVPDRTSKHDLSKEDDIKEAIEEKLNGWFKTNKAAFGDDAEDDIEASKKAVKNHLGKDLKDTFMITSEHDPKVESLFKANKKGAKKVESGDWFPNYLMSINGVNVIACNYDGIYSVISPVKF